MLEKRQQGEYNIIQRNTYLFDKDTFVVNIFVKIIRMIRSTNNKEKQNNEKAIYPN